MYKTKSLDTAAYIYSQGHDCDVRPMQSSYAEFTFKNKVEAEKLAAKYRRGDVVMSLSKYSNSRIMLKQLGGKALSYEMNKDKPCTV